MSLKTLEKNDRYNLLLRYLEMTTTSKYEAREESGGEPGALSENAFEKIGGIWTWREENETNKDTASLESEVWWEIW